MNTQKLQEKLLAAARVEVPSDHVPYAFEQRIMARLHGRPQADALGLWARALWRAAAPCVALALLVGVLGAFPLGGSAPDQTSLEQEFESGVYAVMEQQIGENW